jgi:site-specific DNA-methyltransferase (adenine-specific)
MQTWDKSWTDSELYKKYKLSSEEIEYIESVIKPISLVAKETEDE